MNPDEAHGEKTLAAMRKVVDDCNGEAQVTGMMLFLRVGHEAVGPMTANIAIVGSDITQDAQVMAMACIELNTMMRKLADKHRVPLEAFAAGVAAMVESIRGKPRRFEKQIVIELKPDRKGPPGGRIPADP